MERNPPEPFPDTRYPPERQAGEPTVPMHGRPNKQFPPVFGTTLPLRGVSGAVKRLAYALPDHKPNHWLLMMLGDRIDSFDSRANKLLPFALPFAAAFLLRPSPEQRRKTPRRRSPTRLREPGLLH